ncbi:MAG TPA: chloramphenicol phosphotransferase CPT [Acetobacteraceae bacterium]|jgi:chloramphenicol 3-O phosphotransferase
MAVQVIVLNGGSSSGKSSIARCLQSLLPNPWLTIGVDDFLATLPPAMLASEDGIVFAPDGQITVGPGLRALEAAWSQGVAAMARAGAGIILDLVFLNGAVAQERWRIVLADLQVLWVAVKCDPLAAAAREAARGDRVLGMAAVQAYLVHQGVDYDMEVDTTRTSPEGCARLIADRIISRLG